MTTLGKFFVLEGLECSGKTTLFNILKVRMKDANVKFIDEAAERFAGLSPALYKDKEAMEVAYIIDNAITIHRANDLINRGCSSIVDRSWLSQVVYAQTRRQLNKNYNFNIQYVEKQEEIYKSLYPKVLENTIVIYFDLPLEFVLERASKDSAHHRSEEFDLRWAEIAKSLYQKRLEKAKKDGITVEVINSAEPIEDMTKRFETIFKKYTQQ